MPSLGKQCLVKYMHMHTHSCPSTTPGACWCPCMCRKDWRLGYDHVRAAVNTLAKQRLLHNFGNAGAVNNLLSTAAQRLELRLKDLPEQQRVSAQPTPEDFQDGRPSVGPAQALNGLVDMDEALTFLTGAQATFLAAVRMGHPDPLSMLSLNLIFTGPPGDVHTQSQQNVPRQAHANLFGMLNVCHLESEQHLYIGRIRDACTSSCAK